VVEPHAQGELSRTHGRGTKSVAPGIAYSRLDLAGRPVHVPVTCRESSHTLCWLVELPITEAAPAAKASHRSTR
jgi:hypothetical protein